VKRYFFLLGGKFRFVGIWNKLIMQTGKKFDEAGVEVREGAGKENVTNFEN
jgi:hypothetical protein